MAESDAKSGTTEETYNLVRRAVMSRSPIAATYHGCRRLLCPHQLGWNRRRQPRVLCYQYGGDSESGLEPPGSSANWRCIAVEDLRDVELLTGAWHTAPNHSRPQTCVADVDVDAEGQPELDPQ
jgi:hypothetical protein